MGLDNYRRTVSETKRAAILQAGRDHFLKNGFSHAAVADIAREADVSTATLYKHFTSKEELFAAVIAETYDTLGEEFEDFGDCSDVRELMTRLVRKYLAVQFDEHANALLRVVIAEVPSAPKIALDTYESVVLKRADSIRKILDHLIGRNMLKPHDTALGGLLLSGMIKEVFIWPAMFDPDFKVPQNADVVIDEAISVYLARYGA